MNRYERFYIQQAERQQAFPKDRIAFRRDALNLDQTDLKAYQDGKIGIETLRKRIAYNNYLDAFFPDGKIPMDMMMNELRIMGYDKRKQID